MARPRKTEGFLPTPPLTYQVRWHEQGGKNVKPAFVIHRGEYSPGVLSLAVIDGQRIRNIDSVSWDENEEVDKMTPFIREHGTWSYLPETRIPDSHFELHMEQEDKREANAKRDAEYLEKKKKEDHTNVNTPTDQANVMMGQRRAEVLMNSGGA